MGKRGGGNSRLGRKAKRELKEKQAALTPPDEAQCQTIRPNKTWSPFALGPADVDSKTGEKRGGSVHGDRTWRCREKPVVIVTETESDDGLLGSMSLCADCFVQLSLQRGGTFKITKKLIDD